MRDKTRRERYEEKKLTAKEYPIYVATINLKHDGNFAFVIRSAMCFGASKILLIGSHPPRNIMKELSGSMFDYADVKYFKQSNDFLTYIKSNNIALVSLELPGDTYEAQSLFDFKFDFSKPVCIITGQETTGIPGDILINSQIVYIPMPGTGFCLNTAQCATVALYEAVKQYEALHES